MRETPLHSTVGRAHSSERDQLRAVHLIALMPMLVTVGCGFYMGDGFSSASGHVIGPDRKRLTDYTVKLIDPETRTLQIEKIVHDERDFQIMDAHAPGGGFILRVEKTGYATFEREISGDVDDIEIKLTPTTGITSPPRPNPFGDN